MNNPSDVLIITQKIQQDLIFLGFSCDAAHMEKVLRIFLMNLLLIKRCVKRQGNYLKMVTTQEL
jgi:hypothetical protein